MMAAKWDSSGRRYNNTRKAGASELRDAFVRYASSMGVPGCRRFSEKTALHTRELSESVSRAIDGLREIRDVPTAELAFSTLESVNQSIAREAKVDYLAAVLRRAGKSAQRALSATIKTAVLVESLPT